ncbi:tRNA uridine(34) 5-carboxymethylaminomethyl modification radical SAM/GNAT enzyme Elp3 [Candidatus Woesearchaeota archaeon]|nr:tRNA uridine(34) 5-carboxymethylaminomethyl modification radical SAM/GNAT enzyme Elp3 [Candidatus Woesearchaeota archaeon]
MKLKQVCEEILNEAKQKKVNDLKSFNKLKLQVLNRLKYDKIPKNAAIASIASEEDKNLFKKIFAMKPVRTISGVAPIALMTDPYPCPHTIKGIGPCTYCPGGPGSPFGDVPQSYTGKEPSTKRAIRNYYDSYLGVFNRLEHYTFMNSIQEKAEVILQGGTFPFMPHSYQEYFVKYLLKAMNDFSRLFYKKGELDLNKFNIFFEMPSNIKDSERTERIQKKLLFIRNLNLSNKKVLEAINTLFFSNNSDNLDADYANAKNNFSSEITKKWAKFSKYNNKINCPQTNNLNNGGNERNNKNNANIEAIKKVIKKVNELNDDNISLEQMQMENENAKIRCVGLTIETKSDYGKLVHGNQLLKLGCTRIELGVQSIYENVLEKTNRGNTVKDNIESIRILKDLGFKINMHYMPGLPYTTKEMDRKGLKDIFQNPDYKPDMLKIYPCMVMQGTKLYEDWKAKKFVPLATKEAAEMIAGMKRYVPEWCRIMRVQRDIPTYATSSGVDKTNLRQYVKKICSEKGIKCRCIRCREAGINQIKDDNNKNIKLENMRIKVNEYEASQGREFFISAEDLENDIIFGYCRLRFPSQFLRQEITESSALVRELHVYSTAVSIGKKSENSFQHKGIGKMLMKKAEEIAKKYKKNKIIVLAGIGARQYFAKLGYIHDGPYMSAKIK